VQHLVASGRTRLGYLGIGPGTYTGRERQRCFDVAVAEAGVSQGTASEVVCDANDWEKGFEATLALLDKHPELNGLICYNDYIASGALQACAIRGRQVPADVAVIGIDDIVLASVVSPQLTTLRYEIPKEQVGSLAAQMLLKRIQGDYSCPRITLKHELVVRESAP
jgi:DNA-binding LacI/PurR family transcriptional regulator